MRIVKSIEISHDKLKRIAHEKHNKKLQHKHDYTNRTGNGKGTVKRRKCIDKGRGCIQRNQREN